MTHDETAHNTKFEAPLDSLDDFLSDLGLSTKPLSSEEKFIRRFTNGIEFDNLIFKIRARCQDFRDMKRNGFIIQHKTFRKGVLGLFDVTVEEFIQLVIKDHFLITYAALFDKKTAGDELYLEINETILLLSADPKMKAHERLFREFDKW